MRILLLLRRLTLLLPFWVVLVSCGTRPGLVPGTDLRDLAATGTPLDEALFRTLQEANSGPSRFKGIGALSFSGPTGSAQRVRMAWIGSLPDKIRIETFSLPGYPAVSLASDGRWMSGLVRSPYRFFRRPARQAFLEDVLPVPATLDELLYILSGRIPLRAHRTAAVRMEGGGGPVSSEGGADLPVLVLRGARDRIVQTIRFDAAGKRVDAVDMFEDGKVGYRIRFGELRQEGAFRIFHKVVLETPDGVSVRLETERFWADPAVDAEAFVIKPPDAPTR